MKIKALEQRVATPGAEKEFVSRVEQPNGALKLHTPAEFRALVK